MNEDRLADYLDQMLAAANDACGFVEGMSRDEFLSTSERSRLSS